MRFLPALMHHTYQQADVIVAVSRALGDDLAAVAGLPRERIITIYNPVVGPDLAELAREPVDHPWFAPGAAAGDLERRPALAAEGLPDPGAGLRPSAGRRARRGW